MEYEIVELQEKMVEGIGIKTSNENGKSVQDIGKLWQKFFESRLFSSSL